MVEEANVFEASRYSRVIGVGRATAALARSEQITFLAAALAYYAFASIVPLLLIAAVVATVVGGEAFAADLVEALGDVLTPASQDVLLETLSSTSGRSGATVVGLLALVWSSLKVFRGLDTAFSIVYGTDVTPSFLGTVLDGVIALAAVVVAVAASAVLVAAITFVDSPLVAQFGFVVEVLVLTIAFYPLYYLFPDVEMEYHEAVPGAAVAASGWMALSALFQIYVANAGSFALWGVLGAGLVVVTWLYVGALMLLVGAVVNAVLSQPTPETVEAIDFDGVDRHLQNARSRQPETGMSAEDRDATDDREDADAAEDHVGDDSVADDGRADASSSSAGGAGSGAGPDSDDDEDVETEATGVREDMDVEGATPEDEIDEAALRAQIADLREELQSFEDDVEDRTLHRDEIEGDLKRYVRRRMRRGKARGWGPYLVLLYGTVMTLGAFYTPFLTGGWAIFAMIVIWLSTLGLYTLMVLVGVGANAISLPGRLRDAISDWRS